jgi:hypothetical protein
MSSDEKLEREFAAFLAEDDSRLAALYRKLPQAEPDPRVDGAVRAMAHRALNPQLVATPQASPPNRRSGTWLPALGAAAGIVLAAGIAFRLGPSWHGDRGETGAPASDVISVRSVDAPPPAAPPLSPAPPPAETAAPPAPAASLSGMAKLKTQAEAEAAKPASDSEARDKAARLDDSSDTRPSAAGGLNKVEKPAAAPAQPQAFPAPAPARKRASEMDAVERKQIMATGAWQNLHDRDLKKPASSAAQAAPPSAGTRPMTAAKSAEPQRQEALATPAPSSQSGAPSSRDEAAPPPAPAARPLPQQFAPPPARAAPAPAAKTDAQQRNDAAHATAVAPTVSAEAAQKKENEKTRSKDPNASLYPEHWLENIRAMLRADNRDGALRSLAEFRKMYPDYKLPDDLRDLK